MNNSPLGRLIRHPTDPSDAALKLLRVNQVFTPLSNLGKDPEMPISLAPFCTTRPLCYFNPEAFLAYIDLLNADVEATLESFELHSGETSQAVYAVFRETESWKDEEAQGLSKPRDLLRFDRLWHPEYQRYSEHVFNHLTRIPLELLQRRHGKNYQALELAQRAQKLIDLSSPALAQGFNARIRNAISHGGVHYGDYEIRYVTRSAEESLSAREFLELFDALVDTCSAHICALLAFICQHFDLVVDRGINRLPMGLRFVLLRSLCQHPGFDIEGIVEVGERASGHLNLYCVSATRSQQVHLYEGIHAAVQLYRLGMQYPVISISIECGESTPASLIVNGAALEDALTEGAPPESIGKVVQANLLWHNTSVLGRWFYIFSTLSVSIWKKGWLEIRQQWRELGIALWRERYVVRYVDNRSVGNLRRVLAEIVVRDAADLTKPAVRKIMRHATRVLRRQWICGKDFGKLRFVRFRPTYIWLRVHFGDARVRDIQGRNYADARFLATSEWISIWRRNKPIWVKAPDETFGALRIKWMLRS
jgi:hypothetical protein